MTDEPTVLTLPAELLAAVDRLVGAGRARSRDELIERALRRELADAGRSAVDAEFGHMANDTEYQREARQILAEFDQSDWETLNQDPHPDTGR
ncbi:MAG: ribbon-helix-helix protein, CopG family [Acidobacteriota bacterium]